ncbi:hypothetical protein RND71_015012 [Anisodus tanguticus]|uniref:Uncharacterized protein n=1 Tax=Anisodus tanguticus TaxID=243964 RepID=A0AAE1VFJ4_9SOLA|nr:hypothetical protein RND71_015012 [Anisodus tanguticus]
MEDEIRLILSTGNTSLDYLFCQTLHIQFMLLELTVFHALVSVVFTCFITTLGKLSAFIHSYLRDIQHLKEESKAITSSISDDENIENIQERPVMIRWKSGKKVDPRLIMLLDFFKDLYMKREEFFKKIFPFHHEDFIPIFEKIGVVFPKKDQEMNNSFKRSPSDSSLNRSRGIDESQLKLEKFKVKTPEVKSGGGGGGGSTKASGSK